MKDSETYHIMRARFGDMLQQEVEVRPNSEHQTWRIQAVLSYSMKKMRFISHTKTQSSLVDGRKPRKIVIA